MLESAAGIGAGDWTGLTAPVVAFVLLCQVFLVPFCYCSNCHTAPAFIIVGITMLSSLKTSIGMDMQKLHQPLQFLYLFINSAIQSQMDCSRFYYLYSDQIVKGEAKDKFTKGFGF